MVYLTGNEIGEEVSAETKNNSFDDDNELKTFKDYFPIFLQTLIDHHTKEMPEMKVVIEWMIRVLEYNVSTGNKLIGILVPIAYKRFLKNPTQEQMEKAYALGWIIELALSSNRVAVELMHNKETSKGKISWFKMKDVESLALNDSFLLTSLAYQVAKLYFKEETYWSDLTEVMFDIRYKVIFGSALDFMTKKTKDLSKITGKYETIVKYTSSWYGFYLPVAAAQILAGNRLKMAKVEELMLDIGNLSNAHDEYLDCFVENMKDERGIYIRDNKCTWLLVKAYEKATPKQLECLEENYGKFNPNSVGMVIDIFCELGLPQAFTDFKSNAVKSIYAKIQSLPNDLDKEAFSQIVKACLNI